MEIYIGNHLEGTWLIYHRHRNFPRCRLHLHNHRIYRRIEYIEVSHISVQPNYDPMNIWNEYSNDFDYKTVKKIYIIYSYRYKNHLSNQIYVPVNSKLLLVEHVGTKSSHYLCRIFHYYHLYSNLLKRHCLH